MSDEEIICAWMDARPADGRGERVETSDSRWWGYSYEVVPKQSGVGKEFRWEWHPIDLTLDKLWLVEERLDTEQRLAYYLRLAAKSVSVMSMGWNLIHASATEKIAALAVILVKNPTAPHQHPPAVDQETR